jgi:hypothetical protein
MPGRSCSKGRPCPKARGSTRPLEVLFGAPDLDALAVRARNGAPRPDWLAGTAIRECWFEPTFHKHVGTLCHALMLHPEGAFYDHGAFRPWRAQALAFKAIRNLAPDYPLWRDFPYEYVLDKLAIDVINGGPALREWVDDRAASPPTSTAWPGPTKGPGKSSARRSCSIEPERMGHGAGGWPSNVWARVSICAQGGASLVQITISGSSPWPGSRSPGAWCASASAPTIAP